MKKLLYCAAALATVFFSACQQENLEPAGKGSSVSFTVEVPGLAVTKADAVVDNGSNINDLVYAVYKVSDDATTLEEAVEAWDEAMPVYQVNQETTSFAGGKTTVDLELLNDQNYVVLFWAQVNDAWVPAGTEFDLTNITYPANMSSNNSDLAAFSGRAFIAAADVEKSVSREVTLTRPFAQINVGTTLPKAFTVKFVDSKVTVYDAGESFSVASQSATGTTDVVFGEAALPSNYLNVEGDATDYTYVAMNYVFANGVVEVEYDIETLAHGTVNKTIPSVPVEKNFRTNIIGNLLTTNAHYVVKLDESWGTPSNDVYVWNGTEIEAPTVNAENENIYEIERASELAWLAAAVNGTLQTKAAVAADSFTGKTFVLTEDVDLGGYEWTPIGSSANPFQGVFDGNGKTVKNLVVTGYNSNVGLFGNTNSGEIKNLTVENAKVSGRLNVGVVAGQPYTSKYTNITVTGHVEVNGMAYVGGVGGKNAYADWTNVKVEVDETSYVKAHSIENGTAYRTYVGGVVGFNGEDGHVFSNITSNINVKGSTCDVGGLFGIAHYGNQFVNCVCTGNVEIYAAEEADEAQEIGGIAGVWHNGGANVVMTDCSFTGNLTTNIEGVEFYNGGLVGKPYSATGNGKLIIGGVQYVASAAELQAALDAASGETTLKLGADIIGDVTVVQKQGVKIIVDGNNQKYNGVIKVHSNSNYYADAALTIKNVNFETSAASVNVIEALENGSERYSSNLTVENCTFTATGEAVNTSVAVQVKATRGVTVTGCTATDMHSLVQAQSCDTGDVKVINCTVNGKNGVAFKQVKSATVEGTEITAFAYGIRFDGNIDNYGIVVKNNTVEANQPLIVRKMTGKNNTIALEGTNTLTTDAEYQIVITNGSDDEEYVKPTGTYTLTGTDGYEVFPGPAKVASWDEFTAALAAGETEIRLTADITCNSSYTLNKKVVIDLNANTLKVETMFTLKSDVSIKNGNLDCVVYAGSGNVTLSDITFVGNIAKPSSCEGVLNVYGANVLVERCDMSKVKKSGSAKPRSISTTGKSSGYMIFRDCNFSNSSNLDRPYLNPLSGNAVLEMTNCKFHNASNIDIAASYVWSNMNLKSCTGGFTFTISRASTSLTDEELAIYRDIKQNNSGTKRFIFTDGEKNSL